MWLALYASDKQLHAISDHTLEMTASAWPRSEENKNHGKSSLDAGATK